MTGAAEWSDSWMTVKKTSEDVEEGVFDLDLRIGSRQWGGSAYNVGMEIGRLHPDTHQHVGEVRWQVARATLPTEAVVTEDRDQTRTLLVNLVESKPGHYTRTTLAEAAGGNKSRVLAKVKALLEDGTITSRADPKKPRTVLMYPA